MINDSTSSDPSTPPTTRNVRQSAKGPATDDETDTGGGSADSGGGEFLHRSSSSITIMRAMKY